MSTLYDRLNATPEGARALSVARLKHEALKALHTALQQWGQPQTELARVLGIRKSAVNQVFKGDGNVRIETLADYLHSMGYELELKLVRSGKAREDTVRRRAGSRAAAKDNVEPESTGSTRARRFSSRGGNPSKHEEDETSRGTALRREEQARDAEVRRAA